MNRRRSAHLKFFVRVGYCRGSYYDHYLGDSRAASRSCPLPTSANGTSRSTMGLNTPCSTSFNISTKYSPNRSTPLLSLPMFNAEDAAVTVHQRDATGLRAAKCSENCSREPQ